MEWEKIPRDIEDLLRSHRFNDELFDGLRKRLAAGEMGQERNRISGRVEVPLQSSWTSLPPVRSDERRELERKGRAAIDAGKVGVVILNGGMATRFGGVVKCAVEVLDGRSFLDLKLSDIRAGGGGRVKAYLMNSFATDEMTRTLVEELGVAKEVEHFEQSVMLRVTPDSDLFLDHEQRPSPNAPGHGDLTDSLRDTGTLSSFIEGGGEVLMMSNVDNLGATLDPAVIGAHLSLGGQMTVELVEKDPGDRGGAPALVDGTLQIVENFRFPEAFDQDAIPVFNTNTFVFDAQALDREFPLTWFAVKKKVGGADVIQFERLAGELTCFLDARYLLVPRRGSVGRFLPVKDPEELESRTSEIREVLQAHNVVR